MPVLAVVVTACSRELLPPPGHVLLYLDTDAPVPASFGDPEPQVEPLFDRVQLAVFPPGETMPCKGCEREIPLDRRRLAEKRASIQIPKGGGLTGYRVRARLYLGRHVAFGGTPPDSGTVEVVAALPEAPDEGGTEHTLFLSTNDVGSPKGTLSAPVVLSAGAPSESRVGTWTEGLRRACSTELLPGEACVPGGAFWMGRPGERASVQENDADRPKLVVVSPFTMDENEATVAQVREFDRLEPGIDRWSGREDGDKRTDFCTFTVDPSDRDSRPVTCLTWTAARHYCLSVGKDLPTEAQFEYVSGALASKPFPWGEDAPRCEDAVWGRGGPGTLAQVVAPCRSESIGAACIGPSCDGARARDALRLEGRTIRDLAGNVSEWTLDRFNTQSEACWSVPGPRPDPLCTTTGSAGLRMSIRGGSWLSTGTSMSASSRDSQIMSSPQSVTGFRCVRNSSVACGPVEPGLFSGSTTGDDRGVITSFGVGCTGVVSAIGTHDDGVPLFLAGTLTSDGRVTLEGANAGGTSPTQRFEGRVVDANQLGGTWTSTSGQSGKWSVSRK